MGDHTEASLLSGDSEFRLNTQGVALVLDFLSKRDDRLIAEAKEREEARVKEREKWLEVVMAHAPILIPAFTSWIDRATGGDGFALGSTPKAQTVLVDRVRLFLRGLDMEQTLGFMEALTPEQQLELFDILGSLDTLNPDLGINGFGGVRDDAKSGEAEAEAGSVASAPRPNGAKDGEVEAGPAASAPRSSRVNKAKKAKKVSL
jgi:hypothetical protein